MLKKRIKSIDIGNNKIRYFEIGSGKPLISLVAGIHGDESNSQLVIDKLIGRIKKLKKGTLRVIPLANNSAVEDYSRESPEDDINLNRVFPGSNRKSFTHRLAYKLFNLVKDSDLVIDLHNYYTKIPLVSVYFKVGSKVDKENENLFQFLGSQVWVINIQKEKNYAGSLGGSLSKMGIPNLTIEIPNLEFSEVEDVENCVSRILNLLKHPGVISGKARKYIPKYYRRKICISPKEGIFIPKTGLFKKVKKGQTIGTVKDMITGKEILLHAPITGEVLEILNNSFVYPDREVCAIGKKL